MPELCRLRGAPEMPQAPPWRPQRWAFALAVLLLVAASAFGAQVNLESLASGAGAATGFLAGLWPPVTDGEFLTLVARSALETLALAVAGTLLAIALAVPLALLATGRIGRGALDENRSAAERWVRRAGYLFARSVLSLFRAVPDLVWALVFVVVVGLGAVPGVLAIAVAYAGMLGKLYAEILEGVDARPIEALQATGAPRSMVLLYGAVPPAMPQLVSFTLYAWECAMRAAALLGFVGAGGLGYQIDLAMRMFEFGEVATLLLALFALVALVDGVGWLARRALTPSAEHRLGPRARQAARFALGGACVGAVAASAHALLPPLAAAVADNALGRIERFVRQALPPDTSAEFLGQALVAVWETLAISVIGTALGVVIGGALAYWASHNRFVAPPVALARGLNWRLPIFLASRSVLNVMRAVPEVLWALVAVLAVGLGPFAGALALGVHTAGVLGKLYADTLESGDDRPFEALLGSDASRLVALVYTVVPPRLPVLAAHTLFRWEMNVRAAAVLGLVGGGGLGQAIYTTTQLGFYDRLLTLVLVLYVLVVLIEAIGSRLRAGLNA